MNLLLALQLTFPYQTAQITCSGAGHRLVLAWNFAVSPFLESAVLDGVEVGPDIETHRESPELLTFRKPEVFAVSVPAENPERRPFTTGADIRGELIPLACTVELEWHILK